MQPVLKVKAIAQVLTHYTVDLLLGTASLEGNATAVYSQMSVCDTAAHTVCCVVTGLIMLR